MKKGILIFCTIFSLISFSNVKKEVEFSKDEAINKAISYSRKGSLSSIELDYVKNNPVWDVEIIDGNTKREYKIDAITGKVLSTKVDYEKKVLDSEADILSVNEIKKIVAKHTKNPKYTEISLDKEYGRKVYDIEVIDGNVEISFVIDAHTGEILEIEKD
ncbi:PepSY domain-containing protein [Streptobacillus canis]|uniref:PepSY domain-containing protein n=1 Tax=Streptobacillus canis TaxID=2678686 RepID=UPI0012E16818|nr:PepSY domain-containing protein [Streptobacillus canis]